MFRLKGAVLQEKHQYKSRKPNKLNLAEISDITEKTSKEGKCTRCGAGLKKYGGMWIHISGEAFLKCVDKG